MRQPDLYYRKRELIGDLVERLYRAEEPLPWDVVVMQLSDRPERHYKTIEATIRAAIHFGLVDFRGRYRVRAGDTRTLALSFLGRSWLENRMPEVFFPSPVDPDALDTWEKCPRCDHYFDWHRQSDDGSVRCFTCGCRIDSGTPEGATP